MDAYMQTLFLFLAALVGWAAGSLVNYFCDVLPLRRKLVGPFCLHCQSPINQMSYWVLPGRCPACGRRRSLRAWLVHGFMAGMGAWLWLTMQPDVLSFALSLATTAYFCMVATIDIEYRLIMHPVSLAGVILGLVVGILRHGLLDTILGGLAGFGAMLAFYFLGIAFVRLLARLRGQPLEEAEGLGFGDVNLGLVVGLFLGWPGVLAGLVLAILLGGIVSLVQLSLAFVRRNYQAGLTLPYGPFLAASAVILLYFKDILS